jgi:PAS domain-containing protein
VTARPVRYGLPADGVILTSEDGVLVLANGRAEDMFGYRPGELTGQPVESLVPAGLRAAHVTKRAGQGAQLGLGQGGQQIQPVRVVAVLADKYLRPELPRQRRV